MVLGGCASDEGMVPAGPPLASSLEPGGGGAFDVRGARPGAATAEAGRAGERWRAPEARPGLGTGWGRGLDSPMTYASFVRAAGKPHRGVATIWYNDEEGIEAMTGGRFIRSDGRQRAAGGLVEWGVKSGGRYLRHYHWDGKRFVAGRRGERYSIAVRSHARSRLEVVLSVDGLDVMDGKPASVKKRGYIIWPGQTLEVKGWRTSPDRVASFEFSSVTGSYSNLRHASTRNVGVIGMAVFTEKGIDPWRGYSREAEGAFSASPFAEAPRSRAR